MSLKKQTGNIMIDMDEHRGKKINKWVDIWTNNFGKKTDKRTKFLFKQTH